MSCVINLVASAAPTGQAPTGGDVWVLLIKNVRPSDTDVYVCEVNSDPALRSFHPLKGESVSRTCIILSNIGVSSGVNAFYESARNTYFTLISTLFSPPFISPPKQSRPYLVEKELRTVAPRPVILIISQQIVVLVPLSRVTVRVAVKSPPKRLTKRWALRRRWNQNNHHNSTSTRTSRMTPSNPHRTSSKL